MCKVFLMIFGVLAISLSFWVRWERLSFWVSMSQPVIQVRDLGKLYRIRSAERKLYSTFREDMVNGIKRFVRGDFSQSQSEDFWALKDVSFDVHQGEVVGIIGRNGAGKSTLLKILSRIVQPTTGEAIIRGRVGSLLEVGTGFHPELTGRENIFMNGAVLGMKRAEIKKQFDAIAAFAEVDKFLDTPVKFYSSGMYVRLAFAVAAHLEPEILIVDEVLAVGDAAFQKKCLGKMGDVAAKEGKTVLFVSHNMAAIRRLCDKAILLETGMLKLKDKIDSVVTSYLDNFNISSPSVWRDNQRPGNELIVINSIQLKNILGELTFSINISENLFIEINFEVLKHTKVQFSIVIMDNDGNCIFSSLSNQEKFYHDKVLSPGTYQSACCIYGNLLNNGRFYVSLICFSYHWNFRIDNVIFFDAIDDGILKGDYLGNFGGVIRPKLDWETKKIITIEK